MKTHAGRGWGEFVFQENIMKGDQVSNFETWRGLSLSGMEKIIT